MFSFLLAKQRAAVILSSIKEEFKTCKSLQISGEELAVDASKAKSLEILKQKLKEGRESLLVMLWAVDFFFFLIKAVIHLVDLIRHHSYYMVLLI